MFRAALFGFLAAMTIAGCGGSGGAGGGTGGQASGLVPLAPSPGAVLHADATTLRVLRNGASWTYRGVDKVDEGSLSATVYTNVVRHLSSAAGTVESGSNSLNEGADSTTIRVLSGKVSQPLDLSALGVSGTAIDAIELRSPVRANDQYTIFDQRVANATDDLDGDGKREALDIGIWGIVVGPEAVDILQRPGLETVRVDTTVLVRVRLSSTGQPTETVRITQSVWYAAGIGVVRLRVDVPNDFVPGIRHVTTEELLSWDGVTEGLGPLAPVEAIYPPGSIFAGEPMGVVIDAVGLGTHGVLRVLRGPEVNLVLARIDATGHLTHVAQHGNTGLIPRVLVATSGGVRVISRESVGGLVLESFDSAGQQRKSTPNVLLAPFPLAGSGDSSSSTEMAAAGQGDRIAMMWLQGLQLVENGNSVADLMLRVYDADGIPMGASIVLASRIIPSTITAMRVALNQTHAIATWTESNFVRRYAVVGTTDGALLTSKVLPIEGIAAMPFATNALLGFVQKQNPSVTTAWTLSEQFEPLLGLTGQVSDESVTPTWARPFDMLLSAQPDGSSLLLGGYQTAQIWPEDGPFGRTLTTVLQVKPGTGPLSTSAQVQPLLRQSFSDINFQISNILPLTDKVLVLGSSSISGGTRVAVPVWR